MCVVSMVIEKHTNDWDRMFPNQITPIQPFNPQPLYPQVNPVVELEKFKEWLEMAKKYDEKNKEPECESDLKIKKLLETAEKLGIKEKVAQAIRDVLKIHIESI